MERRNAAKRGLEPPPRGPFERSCSATIAAPTASPLRRQNRAVASAKNAPTRAATLLSRGGAFSPAEASGFFGPEEFFGPALAAASDSCVRLPSDSSDSSDPAFAFASESSSLFLERNALFRELYAAAAVSAANETAPKASATSPRSPVCPHAPPASRRFRSGRSSGTSGTSARSSPRPPRRRPPPAVSLARRWVRPRVFVRRVFLRRFFLEPRRVHRHAHDAVDDAERDLHPRRLLRRRAPRRAQRPSPPRRPPPGGERRRAYPRDPPFRPPPPHPPPPRSPSRPPPIANSASATSAHAHAHACAASMQHARPPASAIGQSPSERHRRRQRLPRTRFAPSPTAPMDFHEPPSAISTSDARYGASALVAAHAASSPPSRTAPPRVARRRRRLARGSTRRRRETRTPGSPRGSTRRTPRTPPRPGRDTWRRSARRSDSEAQASRPRRWRTRREARWKKKPFRAFSSERRRNLLPGRNRRRSSRRPRRPRRSLLTPSGTGTGFGFVRARLARRVWKIFRRSRASRRRGRRRSATTASARGDTRGARRASPAR